MLAGIFSHSRGLVELLLGRLGHDRGSILVLARSCLSLPKQRAPSTGRCLERAWRAASACCAGTVWLRALGSNNA